MCCGYLRPATRPVSWSGVRDRNGGGSPAPQMQLPLPSFSFQLLASLSAQNTCTFCCHSLSSARLPHPVNHLVRPFYHLNIPSLVHSSSPFQKLPSVSPITGGLECSHSLCPRPLQFQYLNPSLAALGSFTPISIKMKARSCTGLDLSPSRSLQPLLSHHSNQKLKWLKHRGDDSFDHTKLFITSASHLANSLP